MYPPRKNFCSLCVELFALSTVPAIVCANGRTADPFAIFCTVFCEGVVMKVFGERSFFWPADYIDRLLLTG